VRDEDGVYPYKEEKMRIKFNWNSDVGDYDYEVVDAGLGYTGATYQYPRLNPATFALITMTSLQHALFEGNSYTRTQRTAVNAFDIGTPISFLITTPNTLVRALLLIQGDADLTAYWELFEDTGNLAEFNVTGGVAATPINRDRNSSNTSTLTITTAPTINAATAAALIATESIGWASSGEELQGYILKQNKKYLARATSYVDNNEGSFSLTWYEYTALE